ncbi:MAG: restriction endonuclease [Acidocella sp.]|nr:restriction endonuclease [Acidocella sp.]
MQSTEDMTSRDYEILTKNIHETLMHAEGHNTISVEHDVKIPGRSGHHHQIDVFWKFKVAGVEHKTAVECKHYSKSVTIETVKGFASLLDDIGNISGIIVTTVGFQKGAKAFAESRGIKLLTIRSPRDEDLSGLILKVMVNYKVANRRTVGVDVAPSEDWVAVNQEPLKERGTIPISGMNNEIGLYDAGGVLVKTFWQIENECPTSNEVGDLPGEQILTYEIDVAGRHLKVDDFGLVPLGYLRIRYIINYSEFQSEITPSQNVSHVMRDIITGDRKLLFQGTDGEIKIKSTHDK